MGTFNPPLPDPPATADDVRLQAPCRQDRERIGVGGTKLASSVRPSSGRIRISASIRIDPLPETPWTRPLSPLRSGAYGPQEVGSSDGAPWKASRNLVAARGARLTADRPPSHHPGPNPPAVEKQPVAKPLRNRAIMAREELRPGELSYAAGSVDEKQY
jgi:hypothetical protein